MENIKFRAWNKITKHMDYSSLNAIAFGGEIYYRNLDISSYPQEIMQYIGRKDCKDNDLFDGDIVQSTYTKDIGIIKHGEFRDEGILQVDQDFYKFDDEDIRKSYGFFVEFEDGQCAIDNKTQIWLEKIGDIHQNPELLEVI